MSLFDELKRRNVFRVGIAYLLAAWVLLQIVDFVLDAISAPNWIVQVFILAAAVGLPIVLVFSWVFEMTPEGVRRESEIDRSQSITPTTGRKLDRVISVFLAVAVVILLADKFFLPEKSPMEDMAVLTGAMNSAAESSSGEPSAAGTTANQSTGADDNQTSIAVLPFVNMSDDTDNEYFSDGISEELLNVLVRIDELRVPSRTSSFSFKGSNKRIDEIGRELQVDHVLEGSVRKSGDRIRVTAQLIDVNTDTHLWSDTYTREVDDIFAVQDEIAQAIVAALQITLSGAQQDELNNRATSNVDAYNAYLLGRHLWNQRTPDGLSAAIDPLSQAVELDPGYDVAWAALADTYALIPEYGAGPIAENVTLGLDAAEKALAINPESARALTARAYIKALYQYDIDGALADFELASSLNPDYATGRQWYGELLAVVGRLDEALMQLDLAAEADPLSGVISHVKGWILMWDGQLEAALQQYAKARQLAPSMPSILGNIGIIHLMLGNYDEAREYAGIINTIESKDPATDLALIEALEHPQDQERHDRAIQLLLTAEFIPNGATAKATLFALLGEYDLAMDNLEEAFTEGDPYAIHAKRIFLYEPLRDDPRFQDYLAKMNLWP